MKVSEIFSVLVSGQKMKAFINFQIYLQMAPYVKTSKTCQRNLLLLKSASPTLALHELILALAKLNKAYSCHHLFGNYQF